MYVLACRWSRSTAADVTHTDCLTGCNSNYLSERVETETILDYSLCSGTQDEISTE
jgi:hypothetical protein